MKQKITIEIENDTGVEFEERGEIREPKNGEYFVAGWSKRIVKNVDKDGTFHSSVVLTPKIDKELEEAKRKFEGKWFKLNSMDMVQKARDVVRSGKGDILILCTNGQTEHVNDCTPFPLPVWRCCVSDKPKKEGNYFLRSKNSNKKTISFYQSNDIWVLNKGDISASLGWENHKKYEWLDEGGE